MALNWLHLILAILILVSSAANKCLPPLSCPSPAVNPQSHHRVANLRPETIQGESAPHLANELSPLMDPSEDLTPQSTPSPSTRKITISDSPAISNDKRATVPDYMLQIFNQNLHRSDSGTRFENVRNYVGVPGQLQIKQF